MLFVFIVSSLRFSLKTVNEMLAETRLIHCAQLVVPVLAFILFYPILVLVSLVYLIVKVFKPRFRSADHFRGQVAVITGSARGFGRDIAIELAKRGCHVAIVDIQQTLAEQTAQHIAKTYGVQSRAYKVDVLDYQQLLQLRDSVTHDLGVPTILVNNAGVLVLSRLENPPAAEITRMINVNLTAVCHATEIFLPKMKELNRGHILNVSSLSALLPAGPLKFYATTKAALRMLTCLQRLELAQAKLKITATTLMPTFMRTNEAVLQLIETVGIAAWLYKPTGQEVAKRAVAAMEAGEEEVVVPGSLLALTKLLSVLPSAISERICLFLMSWHGERLLHSPKVEEILKKEVIETTTKAI